MNVITINDEINLICFFTKEQLEKQKERLEDFCFTTKFKYGSDMNDATYKHCVIDRRKITRELNRRKQNENN